MKSLPGVVLAAMIAALPACTLVSKDLNDTSPPEVVIKVRGSDGQYAPATETKLSVTGSLDLVCVVSDPGGVSMIDVTFSGATDSCTTGTGGVYSGSFSITPLPAELKQTLQGNASGQVLSSLPIFATLAGPFMCSIPGVGKGFPYGDTITVSCVGENWSQNPQKKSAKKSLAVKLF
jgi:hypothetical protein